MTDRPWVIAHRGASGYLPEHTLQAKALAHAQGADFLEQDVVATGDGVLLVCHDIFLDRVTNVGEIFPGRARDDGRHYAVDFSWPELRQLDVRVSSPGASELLEPSARDSLGERYRLCTLEEEIRFIEDLNRMSGRVAGIFPEIKHPSWHHEHGIDLARSLLGLLHERGYKGPMDPIFVQCFDARELRRIRLELGSELRLVQLVGRSAGRELLDPDGLARIGAYATALGANYRQFLQLGERGRQGEPSKLAADARTAGLQLHPYTFNRDDLPSGVDSLEQLLELAYAILEPDAVFCDYPDVAVRLRRQPGGQAPLASGLD